MNHRQNVEPLIYIKQPVLQPQQAWMQKQFEVLEKKENTSENNESVNRDVAFKYLSIREQINYLLTRSEGIPAIHCEIVTDKENFQGVILSQNETEIVLRIPGRPYQNLPRKDIQRIRLMGF